MNSALEILNTGKISHVKVSGKLTKEAYSEFVPALDRQIEEFGKIRILFEMQDFHGWTAGAMWEDFKFDLAHWKDIERLAIAGDAKWEKGMSVFCKPFTSASIQYFDVADMAAATEWLRE